MKQSGKTDKQDKQYHDEYKNVRVTSKNAVPQTLMV